MRVSRTLSASIALEIALYMGLGFLTFVVVMLAQNLAQRLQDLVAVGFVWSDALDLLLGLLPLVAAYSVPVGFLFGVLAAVARLSADAEVTALRACGLGLGSLLVPALAIGLVVSAATAVLMIHSEPASRREMRAVMARIASRGGILEPGQFHSVGPRVLYVQSRGRDNRIYRILVADRTDPKRPFIIFAERGSFSFDPDQMAMHLELENGDLHIETRDTDVYQRITFKRFDYAIDASAIFDRAKGLRPREMPFSALVHTIALADQGRLPPAAGGRDPDDFRTQLHRRLALPFAPLLFALIGVPLGLRRTRSARSWGVLVCAFLAATYYLLLTFCEYMGEDGTVPPIIAMWVPNVAFAVASIPLLRRAQRGDS
jgi:lipopolysaccharide export system permease protein